MKMPPPPPTPIINEVKPRMDPKARELHSKHTKAIKTLKKQVDSLKNKVTRNGRGDRKNLRILREGDKKYTKE